MVRLRFGQSDPGAQVRERVEVLGVREIEPWLQTGSV